MTSAPRRRAHVVGLGLIGASLALALAERGWTVTGDDADGDVLDVAQREGIIEGTRMSDEPEIVFVATPAGVVSEIANALCDFFDSPSLVVTDVAGVKSSIVAEVRDPRFVGGHPMAGSELRGLRGAKADLFQGCNWVLTPTDSTSPATYSVLHGILRDLGANVVAVSAEDHDRLVAIASHVPHLLAGALMNEAAEAAQQDAVLLQLAAGGFRDMTRIAAGDPSIWPDVLFENRDAVTDTLVGLEKRLENLRIALADDSRDILEESLTTAAEARRQLPGRALSSENLSYLRVGVADQPGVLAAVTRCASELLVNIYDIEIAHGIEGVGGTLLLAVDSAQVATFAEALAELGFQVVRER
ncbi:MAG TPA: prephenate dehydrogenase/arogenate dehydrogenase family protein [Acidimicrobiales bacterium]